MKTQNNKGINVYRVQTEAGCIYYGLNIGFFPFVLNYRREGEGERERQIRVSARGIRVLWPGNNQETLINPTKLFAQHCSSTSNRF